MKFLNAHITHIPPEQERFDTLASPSGTVATLNAIAKQNDMEHVGFDSAYPGSLEVKTAIYQEIEDTLSQGKRPVLLATTLLYNAQTTLEFIKELSMEYHKHVTLLMGGQLVTQAPEAFLQRSFCDGVCIGDAEVLIPQIKADLLRGKINKQIYKGFLRDTNKQGMFSFVDYDNFYQIRERLQHQKEICGFSQLCIQGLGGPGCSWAANNQHGACSFCALQNITEMHKGSLGALMECEKKLQDDFAPDRLFDVSNQFLPFSGQKQNAEWLRQYIAVRNRYGVTVQKYAYLTVASLNEEICALLREAGIVEVYLGIDHLDAEALKEQNKSHRTSGQLEKSLKALRSGGITARMGIVVGASKETEHTLQVLKDGLGHLLTEFNDVIKTVGVFPIYMLPGSKIYQQAIQPVRTGALLDKSFKLSGYFTPEEERQFTELHIKEHSDVSPEQVFKAIEEMQAMAKAHGATAYDYKHSPGPEVMKG